MDFLLKEPTRTFWVHASDWRTTSIPVDDINLSFEFRRNAAAAESRMPGTLNPGEVLDELRVKLIGNVPESGSLLLHLPYAYLNDESNLISVDGGKWQWMFPLLEVFLPVNEIVICNYPVPLQPERILLESFIRCPDGRVLNLPEAPIEIGDMPAERLEVRLSSNFSGNLLRYSVVAEQPAAQRFMADRLHNCKATVQVAGKDVEVELKNGVATGSIPLPAAGAMQMHSCYLNTGCDSNLVDTDFYSDLGLQLYWGDIHVHSHESDGIGEPEAIVERARDWQRLDFMAFQEHIEHDTTWRIWRKSKWDKLKNLYDRSTVNGEFVIIPGYEYRGFCNMWCFSDEYTDSLYPELNGDDAHPMHGLIHKEWDDDQVLIRRRIINTAAKPDWLVGYHRLELIKDQQRCLPPAVQFLQMAHYKRPPEVGSADYLLRGDRVGFFGSTDTHIGMPGTSFNGPREAASGLTAVLAKELSRDGLHQAMRKRNCYASLGARTLLDVRLNGEFMGGESKVADGAPIEITIRAAGRERLAGFEIVSRGQDLEHHDLNGKTCFEHTFRTRRYGVDDDYFFVRLHLEDGRMVWSSPNWCIE
ncbi:MAG: DUF3604 domain-containing protein [Lentisphaerae bacterium]|nr:DUF3604 domain-containing protein [Lentisphaerota bacterium]